MSEIRIERATEKDVPLVLSFLNGLAEYEKLTDAVKVTEEILRDVMFGERGFTEAIIAYEDEKPVGFAFYYFTFTTFPGHRGLYLEDLFVKSEMRGRGVGKALLVHLARLAKERGCERMMWQVLTWNEKAIAFYESLGAKKMNEWLVCRLTDEAFERLANVDG
jgi:GNAT superfamily N-acetyltransferase